MEFFDTHAHYTDEKYNQDREQIIEQLYKNNITKVVTVGTNVKETTQAIELAQKYDFMYATSGLHPEDLGDKENQKRELEQLEQLAHHEKIVAIGEIGLDYYWNKENKEEQKTVFSQQIEMANRLNLPIVVHSRDAIQDTITILTQKECYQKGIIHCCPLNIELVKSCLKLGYYISFAGPITFKNSKNAAEVVKIVPLERILIETDSPYLSPEPYRGTKNNSINVKKIAEKIAEFKEVTIEQIAKQTYENAKTIFNIK